MGKFHWYANIRENHSTWISWTPWRYTYTYICELRHFDFRLNVLFCWWEKIKTTSNCTGKNFRPRFICLRSETAGPLFNFWIRGQYLSKSGKTILGNLFFMFIDWNYIKYNNMDKKPDHNKAKKILEYTKNMALKTITYTQTQ